VSERPAAERPEGALCHWVP